MRSFMFLTIAALVLTVGCQYDYDVGPDSVVNDNTPESFEDPVSIEDEACAYSVVTWYYETDAMNNKLTLEAADMPDEIERGFGKIGSFTATARNPSCNDLDVLELDIRICGYFTPDNESWWESFNETGVSLIGEGGDEIAFLDEGNSAWNTAYGTFCWGNNTESSLFVSAGDTVSLEMYADTSLAKSGDVIFAEIGMPVVDDGEQETWVHEFATGDEVTLQ